jgi:hypothetical protein
MEIGRVLDRDEVRRRDATRQDGPGDDPGSGAEFEYRQLRCGIDHRRHRAGRDRGGRHDGADRFRAIHPTLEKADLVIEPAGQTFGKTHVHGLHPPAAPLFSGQLTRHQMNSKHGFCWAALLAAGSIRHGVEKALHPGEEAG